MPQARDTHKYQFKMGNKIVHVGITNDLERREGELRREYDQEGHITQVGYRTTRAAALEWEDEQRKQGKPVGP